MAKIRTVKPELFRHEVLFEAEQPCRLPLRLAFIGLFTCCDREGRFRWEPRALKLDILPYDAVDFVQILHALWEAGFIKKYVWQNKYYGFIPSWHQHQAINKHEPASKLPDPEKCTPESFPIALGTSLQVEAPVKQVSTSAHIPISDPHMHARALHEPVSTLSDFEKHTDVSPTVALNTPLQMHASAKHVPLSTISHDAMQASVSACLASAAHPMTTRENNTHTTQPIDATEPVPQRMHLASDPKQDLDACTPLPKMHMHARALHEAVRATHHDASAAHVHASLEVEMEVEREMEVEMEVEVEEEVEVEREVEMEMEKSLGAHRNIVAPARRRSDMLAQISTIFNHWKITLQHPHAVLDKKRHRLIQQALQQGYTAAQLCDAISGCAQTPHNMGDNERGQPYDGLHIILGDSDQIERFMHNYHRPPRPPNPADKLLRANMTAGKNWLQRKKTEESNDEKP